jgi:hypothetical protein
MKKSTQRAFKTLPKEDRTLFLKNRRERIKEESWTKATYRMNRWDAVKQELLEQNDRALLHHTKQAVIKLLDYLGFYGSYSGRLKQMFIRAQPTVGETFIEPIDEIQARFSDLPFGLKIQGTTQNNK